MSHLATSWPLFEFKKHRGTSWRVLEAPQNVTPMNEVTSENTPGCAATFRKEEKRMAGTANPPANNGPNARRHVSGS
jgi:hypothetical protein